MIIRKNKQGNLSRTKLPSDVTVQKVVKKVLRSEKIPLKGEINIVFVDSRIIKKINVDYLKKNKTTDVIAFPYDRFSIQSDADPFGDVYICAPEAAKNAKRFNQKTSTELIRLMIHGILHILGYEDDDPPKKKIMWDKQEKLVKLLC